MATYKTTPNYPNGSNKPRMEILRDDVAMSKPTFEMKDIEDKEARKKADEYASELQRETRGKKAGELKAKEAENTRDALQKYRAEKKGITVEKMRKDASDEFDKRVKEGYLYKRGGTVRSASSRADGIASKGKTRGKIC
jgi:multidrug resistance efflux pump